MHFLTGGKVTLYYKNYKITFSVKMIALRFTIRERVLERLSELTELAVSVLSRRWCVYPMNGPNAMTSS